MNSKPILLKICITLISLFLSLNIAAETPPGGYYNLLYSKRDAIASIEFNGIVIVPESEKQDISGQIDLNMWMMPEGNKLKIKGIKKTKEDSMFPSAIKANLFLGKRGEMPDEGKKIAGFEWKEGEGDIVLPFEKEITVMPTEIPPSDLWSAAEEIKLSEDDIKGIQVLVQAIFDSIQKKDEVKMYSLLKFRFAELSKTRYYPVDEAENKSGIKMIIKLAGGKLKTLKPDKLKYTLAAGNKIVVVTTKNGKYPLDSKDGEFSIPVHVSRIKGEWVLSR